LDVDRDARRAAVEAMPLLAAEMAKAREYDRRLRGEHGV